MVPENSFIERGRSEGVATIRLNRPPLNVLHIPMLRELETELAGLAADTGVRVLVLSGAGKMFSAGVDIADHTPERVGEMLPLFHDVCRSLAEFPVPTIAALGGPALGGGCELVLCCDLAVMDENAGIGQPEIQLAAIAPVAALRLPYFMGYRAAAEMLFTGHQLTAQEALELGLINSIAAAGKAESAALDRAYKLAGMSRAAMTRFKSALLNGYGNWAAELAQLEDMYLQDLMRTRDAVEGLQAFMEKRKPNWVHH